MIECWFAINRYFVVALIRSQNSRQGDSEIYYTRMLIILIGMLFLCF